jgi:hypothetical protein
VEVCANTGEKLKNGLSTIEKQENLTEKQENQRTRANSISLIRSRTQSRTMSRPDMKNLESGIEDSVPVQSDKPIEEVATVSAQECVEKVPSTLAANSDVKTIGNTTNSPKIISEVNTAEDIVRNVTISSSDRIAQLQALIESLKEEAKKEARKETVKETEQEPKQETGKETQQKIQQKNVEETVKETPLETHQKTKQETKQKTKQEAIKETQLETHQKIKQKIKPETKQKINQQAKHETQPETKQETTKETPLETHQKTKQKNNQQVKQETAKEIGGNLSSRSKNSVKTQQPAGSSFKGKQPDPISETGKHSSSLPAIKVASKSQKKQQAGGSSTVGTLRPVVEAAEEYINPNGQKKLDELMAHPLRTDPPSEAEIYLAFHSRSPLPLDYFYAYAQEYRKSQASVTAANASPSIVTTPPLAISAASSPRTVVTATSGPPTPAQPSNSNSAKNQKKNANRKIRDKSEKLAKLEQNSGASGSGIDAFLAAGVPSSAVKNLPSTGPQARETAEQRRDRQTLQELIRNSEKNKPRHRHRSESVNLDADEEPYRDERSSVNGNPDRDRLNENPWEGLVVNPRFPQRWHRNGHDNNIWTRYPSGEELDEYPTNWVPGPDWTPPW